MMKNRICILMGLMFILLSVNVLALTATFEEDTIDLFTSVSKNAYINITNDLNTTIYYVTLTSLNTDIQFIDNEFTLEPLESKRVKLVISTTASYSLTSNIDIIYFEKNDVILQPTETQIQITNIKYDPDYLEIVEGSSVIWNNSDSLTHSVTSEQFDADIVPQENFQRVFDEVGIYSYYDKFTNYNGKIVVLGQQGEDYTHNPNQDFSISINILSKRVETTLEVDFIDTSNFTVETNSQKDSVLLIKNVGNKTAEMIHLKGDWLSFGKNDFFLEPNGLTYVTFTIIPIISNSNLTDQTYIKDIVISSNNTLDINKSISIYIPYKADVSIEDTITNIFNQTLDDDFLVALHNIVCEAHPDYKFCTREIQEIIVYRSPPLAYNYTQEDIHEYYRRQLELSNNIQRANEEFNALLNAIKGESQLSRENSESTKLSVETLTSIESDNSKEIKSIFILVIVITLIMGMALTGYYGYRWLKKMSDNNNINKT